MSLQSDIEQFINANKQDAFAFARDFQVARDLVLYGETHVGPDRKSSFLARLINAGHVRYHASEHFINSSEYSNSVDGYLHGRVQRSGLPSGIRAFTAILDAIRTDTNRRGVVFAGTGSSRNRDELIFRAFTASLALHVQAGRFTRSDKGHFLIGAAHAARLPTEGSATTTAQRLMTGGFNCGIIRMLVDESGNSTASSGGAAVTAGENDWVEPVNGGDAFELLPLIRARAGGTPIGIDAQIARNPFFSIRPAGLTSSRSFSQYYDALIYLP